MRNIFVLTLLLFLFFLNIRISFAHSPSGSTSVESGPTPSPSPTPIPYILPFPGILPDHPLWFLKAFRDRIIVFLISSPVKKAEFSLSQSDKRLSAGVALFAKGKNDPALSTISKAENYLVLAVAQTKEAKAVGKDVAGLIDVLFRATQKHQAVLIEEVTAHPQMKDKLIMEQKRVAEQEKLVNDLRK